MNLPFLYLLLLVHISLASLDPHHNVHLTLLPRATCQGDVHFGTVPSALILPSSPFMYEASFCPKYLLVVLLIYEADLVERSQYGSKVKM